MRFALHKVFLSSKACIEMHFNPTQSHHCLRARSVSHKVSLKHKFTATILQILTKTQRLVPITQQPTLLTPLTYHKHTASSQATKRQFLFLTHSLNEHIYITPQALETHYRYHTQNLLIAAIYPHSQPTLQYPILCHPADSLTNFLSSAHHLLKPIPTHK